MVERLFIKQLNVDRKQIFVKVNLIIYILIQRLLKLQTCEHLL